MNPTRRDFLKTGAAAGLGTVISAMRPASGAAAPFAGPARAAFRVAPIPTVRVGFVGVGGMGSVHVQNFLNMDGVVVKAICDVREDKVARARKWVEEAGQASPAGYSRGPKDFERMCAEEDLDLILTATPWEWHVPVCVAAMRNGKNAATEVPAAVTLEECWQLVETAEKTGKHCVMMENCCYDRLELRTLNMVRKGLLGEILHAEAGYLHDLREVKFSAEGEGLWRRRHSMLRNGNLYPTHGLGPAAQCMNINRGDAFDTLVSCSSPSRGLQEYALATFGPDSSQAREKFVLGDINTSILRTKNGRTIILIHDTNLPRPYTRINLVQGTKGVAQKWPDQVYVDGRSPKHEWQPFDEYLEFEHPLWTRLAAQGEGRGHGGMDFIEDFRLVESLRKGEPMDADVYDAAAWSAVQELSVRSVARKGAPQAFPDFTRGGWRTNPPLGIVV
jgi:predicted dehydrogenase